MRRETFGGGPSPYLEALEKRRLLASGIGTFVPGSGTWSLRSTASAGPADVGTFQFGANVPVVGDWNGDGRDDIGTFSPLTATWSLRYGASAGSPDAGVFVFGKPGTLPVVGDWNGDGRDDIGVYDPKKAQWSLRLGASAGPANAGSFSFGAKNALPVAGDWNGDGKDGIGTFEIGSATWTLRQTATAGSADAGTFKFGSKITLPVVGDWDGDTKDGIGAVNPRTATWTLRQTASAGTADAGTFVFGPINSLPVAGDFKGPAPAANVLTSVTLKPLDLQLLGLEVQTSPITVTITSKSGDGNLVGNLLDGAANLINTTDASSALTNVLGKAVDLANASDLSVAGIAPGAFDTAAAASTTQVLELFVAPTHLDSLGVQIDMSPVRLSVSAHAGQGLVLGNALTVLSNLFNPPLPDQVNIDTVNQNLTNVLGQLNAQLGSIPAADVPTVPPSAGDVLTFAVPGIDVNLLGMELETDPVTFDASAQTGGGRLLGNVWTAALNTRDVTPDTLAQMSNTVNGVLARVFGALNASALTLSPGQLDTLSPAMQALLSPTLFSPVGSSAPILDFVVSAPANTPPATVDLLGLSVASNDVNAQLRAVTGDGQVLGNLLYNAANLTNPGGPATLISLMKQLASNSTSSVGPITGYLSPAPTSSSQLFTMTLPPLDLNLLGLEVQTEPMTVKLTAESGNGDLVGNVLRGYTSLLNLGGVNGAVNNVLSTAASLVNSAALSVSGVGSGVFDTAPAATTQILDSTVAPVHINLTGAQVDTSPIHMKLIAHSGDGLVLGNVLTNVANVFNPPLPGQLDTSVINVRIQQMLTDLNAQVPGIAPAQVPPQNADPGSVLGVTVPALNLDLLGLGVKTDPVIVNAAAHTGNGDVLGNIYAATLNTMDTTPSALGGVSANVSALLAKVVGVFNAGTLTLSPSALAALPPAYQTLANPTLINPVPGATMSFLDLGITSATGTNPPTSVGVLGLNGATSGIHMGLTSRTGDGLILGNMLYNVANLLNPGASSNFLYLLDLLA